MWLGGRFFFCNNNYNNISHSDIHSTRSESERERGKKLHNFPELFFLRFFFLPFVLDWIGVKHFFFVFVSDFFLIDFRVLMELEGG